MSDICLLSLLFISCSSGNGDGKKTEDNHEDMENDDDEHDEEDEENDEEDGEDIEED